MTQQVNYLHSWYNTYRGDDMCGRFTIAVNKEDVKEHLYQQFGIEDFDIDFFLPRYNIAPGEKIIAVISDGKSYRAGLMRWGFVPHFSGAYQMINAKRETIQEKSAFKNAFYNRRCLLLADGYYEWKKEGNRKIPYRITIKDRNLIAFAGIWNYGSIDGNRVATCAIITGAAGPNMSWLHERVPVILKPDAEKIWLNPESTDPKLLYNLTEPLPDSEYRLYPVSSLVNNSRNDVIECIKPLQNKNER